MERKLRCYQQEAHDKTLELPKGSSVLWALAPGMGKTYTASQFPRFGGRMLWLANQNFLVEQPLDCFKGLDVGIEMSSKISDGEEIVLASVQSLSRRLNKFKPNEFSVLICDEAQYAVSPIYRKCIQYFTDFHYRIGLSATPKRRDNVSLRQLFNRIVISRDAKWAIDNGFLVDLDCLKVTIPESSGEAISEVHRKHSRNSTLIFAKNVKHSLEISRCIPGSEVIVGATKPDERERIFANFRAGKCMCIVSVNTMRVGVDLPRAETAIFARSVSKDNDGLFQQMLGRVMRTWNCKETGTPLKERGLLIDCHDVSSLPMVTIPSLMGIDIPPEVENRLNDRVCQLSELPNIIQQICESELPEGFITNIKAVDMWTKSKYDFGNVDYKIRDDGSLYICVKGFEYVLSAPDAIGNTRYRGNTLEVQDALYALENDLKNDFPNSPEFWNKHLTSYYSKPITDAQKKFLSLSGIDVSGVDVDGLTLAEYYDLVKRHRGIVTT